MREFIGIDLGGTNIKFITMNGKMETGELLSLPTPIAEGRDAVTATMVAGCRNVAESEGIDWRQVGGVGVGSPGPLDRERGILLSLPNLPGMDNLPLQDILEHQLDVPVRIENDANAAAYGEFIKGAGQSVDNMVMLTLGTGLGSGIIIDGKILHGAHSEGGELGHMLVAVEGRQCPCGQSGCIEQYVSAANIPRYAEMEIRKTGEGRLAAVLKEKGLLACKDVTEAWRKGDQTGKRIWEEAMKYLAMGCVNVCRIFDPDRIVLAGGMTNAGDSLLEPLKRHWAAMNWTMLENKTDIAIATLGNEAGAIGAAGVVMGEVADVT